MKKLVVALMLISLSVISCGKNNSTNSGSSNSVNPITVEDASASTLAFKIQNYQSSFGLATIYYYGSYVSLQQLSNSGLNMTFQYAKSTSSSSSFNVNWSICFIKCTGNISAPPIIRTTKANEVNITEKQNELIGIINNVNPLVKITSNGYQYTVTAKDGKRYLIDLKYPIQAQPTAIMDSTGTEYLYMTNY